MASTDTSKEIGMKQTLADTCIELADNQFKNPMVSGIKLKHKFFKILTDIMLRLGLI
jgi:hypothetical protein